MAIRKQKGWIVRPWRQGLAVHRKVSYPARYGCYHELITPEAIYHLALDGFPRFLQGTSKTWPHPQEWLKLTRNGDWVYYSTQGYSDLFDLTGEYYYPLLPYPSNPIFKGSPDTIPGVADLLAVHDQHCAEAARLASTCCSRQETAVLLSFSQWTSRQIRRHAEMLHQLIQGRIPVLPPDCRHVDYDVLPVLLSEGCLANCGFCRIKTGTEFRLRSHREVRDQLEGLKNLLGKEVGNYRAIFLGQHDALAAGSKTLVQALDQVQTILAPGTVHVRKPVAFLFGSTRSLLALDDNDLKRLDRSPFGIVVNIGLESFDQETLEILKKPVRVEENLLALQKMVTINRSYPGISISGNLVLGDGLGSRHIQRIVDVLSELPRYQPGSTLYLSPLSGACRTRDVPAIIRRLKSLNRLEIYPYLIQRF
ncbi:radical SAM protein [Desulfolithobacter sp.]